MAERGDHALPISRAAVHEAREGAGRVHDPQMGQHRPLRHARGAGGVEDRRHRLLVRARRRRRGLGVGAEQTVVVAEPVDLAERKAADQRRRLLGRGDDGGRLGLADQQLRAGLDERMAQPRRLVAQRQRHQDRAEARHGVGQHHEGRVVAQQQRHTVARPHALGVERGRQPAHLLVELRPGEAQLSADQRLCVGARGDRGLEHGVDVGGAVDETVDHPRSVVQLPSRRGVYRCGHGVLPGSRPCGCGVRLSAGARSGACWRRRGPWPCPARRGR